MSSKTHLPPRCPSQGKTISRPVHCPVTPVTTSSSEDTGASYKRSQQPPRLNNLLTDSGKSHKFSQQSAIKAVAVSDGVVSSQTLSSTNDHESSVCIATVTDLESTCTYGPNSPKSKDPVLGPVSTSSSEDTAAFYNLHQKCVLEQKPPRLNNISTDSDASRVGICSQKLVTDSVAVSDGVVSSQTLSSDNDHESSDCIGTGTGLESTCSYGPNSPKSKDKLSFPETSVVSALSEYLSLNPLQKSDDRFLISGMLQCDLAQGTSASVRDVSSETLRRRQIRERSRSHKVHYIAELERAVDDLQKLEAELALRVSSLLQQRAVLSIENSNLKQQIARVEQDKLIAEGEYQSLKQEEEWLKFRPDFSSEGRCTSTSRDIWSSFYDYNKKKEMISLDNVTWKLPDLRKLDLI